MAEPPRFKPPPPPGLETIQALGHQYLQIIEPNLVPRSPADEAVAYDS